MKNNRVLIIGAGLAGSDAAWFLAHKGFQVVLAEGKGKAPTPAQKLKTAAELVCTNSLKSMSPHSAHGLLKFEMRSLGSLILQAGEACAVPAGEALAVDREQFSSYVHKKLQDHPHIDFYSDWEVVDPLTEARERDCDWIIMASGPLTSPRLEQWICEHLSRDDFYFYDAIAPIVDADSLDLSQLYFKDRHGAEGGDYLNVPLDKEQYQRFVAELVAAEKVPPAQFEEMKYFEACLPIDLMAERGAETLRFGCMKPIGLERASGERPYAVIQLRKENLAGSAYNMVGFQTRLKYGEQLRIFRTLPGFAEAEFLHLGSVHRNSFLNAKKLLHFDLSSRQFPQLHFAGQMTGVEGYTESAAMGLYVAYQLWHKQRWGKATPWPVETAMGALVNYLMTAERAEPKNINFGLLPEVPLAPLERKNKSKKTLKKLYATTRAHDKLVTFLSQQQGALDGPCHHPQ